MLENDEGNCDQPEEGLEVIVTGRLTTFAGRQNIRLLLARWKWLVKGHC